MSPKWNIPVDLKGTVVDSFEELQAKLTNDFKVCPQPQRRDLREHFKVFRGEQIFEEHLPKEDIMTTYYIAYECPSCNKIIIDRPRKKECGDPVQAIFYFCGSCNKEIGDIYYFHSEEELAWHRTLKKFKRKPW